MTKSFGVFGWATDATGSASSYIQDWRHMCLAAADDGNCPSPLTNADATTVEQIIAISIWANDSTASAFSASGETFKIVFSVNKWAT